MTAVVEPRPPVDPAAGGRGRTALVEVVVPVFDEEHVLEASVRRLHEHLSHELPYRFRITIADNASTDRTLEVARSLAAELPGVEVVHLDEKGRGRALAAVWSASDADVLAYTDVDLSTDLAALLPLVAPLVSGHSDLAIGSRLSRSSRVLRGPRRELISRSYNLILRGTLQATFSDAQCGFKAIRRDVAAQLLPLVEDTGWFFDTELLVLAERSGLRIHEVPVDWVDDPDSRVDVVRTAVEDLRGVARLARSLATGRLPLAYVRQQLGRGPLEPEGRTGLATHAVRFAAVGLLSTLAYALLYLALRPVAGAQGANLLALLVTAVGNTAANRRFTFGVSGRDGAVRHQAQGLLVFALGLAVTSGSLAGLHVLVPDPGRVVELGVLVAANAVATVLRFALMRAWVFGQPRAVPSVPSSSGA
ncbi:bifunctional glycosyltransferase family 2/GtrA family protein [Angustibacter peucedani]